MLPKCEGVRLRSLASQVIQPLDRFLHRGMMTDWHPPEDKEGLIHLLEPLASLPHDLHVKGTIHKLVKRLD